MLLAEFNARRHGRCWVIATPEHAINHYVLNYLEKPLSIWYTFLQRVNRALYLRLTIGILHRTPLQKGC